MLRVLSDSGIKKLAEAKAAILSLQLFDEPEGSVYSKEMRDKVIKIIDYIVSNNGITLLTNSKAIADDIAFLDDSKSSLLPDVFNLESLHLAKILLNTLQTVDLLKDLTSLAYKLTPENKINFFFARLRETLSCKIDFYQQMLKHARQVRDFVDIIANAEELHRGVAAADNAECLEVAVQRYSKMSPVLLEVFESCHYFRLSNAECFVNQARPFIIQSDKIENTGVQLLLNLLEIEDKINAVIKKFDKTPVSVIFNYCKDAFLPSSLVAINTRFLTIIARFQAAADFYKCGEHLPLFKSVNPKKLAILNKALDTLTALKECTTPLPHRIFEAFKCLTTAALENATLAKSKGHSLGELSRSIHQFQMEFFQATLNLNHELDETLFIALKDHPSMTDAKLTAASSMLVKR